MSEEYLDLSNPSEITPLRSETTKNVEEFSRGVYLKYFWKLLLLIAGFYVIPSLQFVVFQENSNTVECYYNFKCKSDLGKIPAFNNIISNIFYIFFALLFYVIVITTKPFDDGVHGLHGDMSLYFTLALALGMEGVFSSIYHVCPSRLNFQFDTTFMMIGVALLFVAIFQKRHAKRTIGAPRFYAYLAILTFANSLTLFTGKISPLMWTFVMTILISSTTLGSIHIYYGRAWSFDRELPQRILANFQALLHWEIEDKPRFIVIVIANILTYSVAFAGIFRASQFSDYIMSVFMVNIMIYLVYYIVMKRKNGEPVTGWIYFLTILTLVLVPTALAFFNIAVTDKQLSPEESRELNKPCILFGYFDSHDIWHALSASAIFVLLLLIFVLDKGIENYNRKDIIVF